MRKISILLFLLFSTVKIYPQTYTVNFTAIGAATTFDSIKVENLTHPSTLHWYPGDILHLILTSGINDFNLNNESIKICPNPFQGQAEVSFLTKKTANTIIRIYDIAGKEILQTANILLKGNQKYLLSGLKQGMYFIDIKGDDFHYTSKLISINNSLVDAKISNIGSKDPGVVGQNSYKNTMSTLNMSFTSGDNLRFTGYSGTHSAIAYDSPNTSKTIIINFTTTVCPSLVTDIDNNIYDVVLINNQCWLKQNLKARRFRNGDSITNIIDNTSWGSYTSAAYCNYNNDTNLANTYGRLYNFYVVSDSRKVCPTGWHPAANNEWDTLVNYLGGDNIAGGRLKESGLAHWNSPNTGATNESDFTALPSANRNGNGTFMNVGYTCMWWTSTEDVPGFAWMRGLGFDAALIYNANISKNGGFSIRCIKD
ncbi:MAG: T9SS type A sorting domain-containing protein [Bacteroidetes bacterium]|nr:T9SS type A sorting domain-containing protein [Bacteroidota bacterium]